MSASEDLVAQRPAAPRRSFVGRARDLDGLRRAFDAAFEGNGSVAAVLGEPGIGKTSLCEELARYATKRGARVLIGRCFEDGTLRLPYLPFVEVLRQYLIDQRAAASIEDLGSSAAELARLVPEFVDRLGVEAPADTSADVVEHRYRLYEAVAEFLRRIAASQPLVVILEDLHDADQGTLDLLLHVARQLARSRLLVIGTYRDLEVDRAHPLAHTLARLRSSAHLDSVHLTGLTTAEVEELMTSAGITDAGAPVAEAVRNRTDGNPLFVGEMARILRNWSVSAPPSANWSSVARAQLLGQLPDGLREAISKRLERLSPTTNRVLSVAAVIGREFELPVLRLVADLDEEHLAAVLQEAVHAGVLQEYVQPGMVMYQFTHALVRQSLYTDLIAPRRLRLHQQVARALETRYAGRLQQHAAELAEHFAHSTETADLSKVVEYCRLAASAASAVFAFDEAVRQLSKALQVLEMVDPAATAQFCDLYLELGQVLIPAGESRRAFEEVAPKAYELAEMLVDNQRASRAAQLALDGMLRHAGAALQTTPAFRTWAERADQYAASDSLDRVYADHALGDYAFLKGDPSTARVYFARALELAKRLGDREAVYQSARRMVHWVGGVDDHEKVLRLASEVLAMPRDGVRLQTQADLLWHTAMRFLIDSNRARFQELASEVTAIAGRSSEPTILWRPLVRDIIEHTLDGELNVALEGCQRLIERADELGIGMLGRVQAYQYTLPIRQYLGSFEDRVATEFNEEFWHEQLMNVPTYVLRGDSLRARRILSEFLARLPPLDLPDVTHVTWLVVALESAVLLNDRQTADMLSRKLALAAGLGGEPHAFAIVGRVLGDASLLCGDSKAARAHYERALAVAEAMHHQPEIALLHVSLAEVLPRTQAEEHLEYAIPLLESMHMRPGLERALMLRSQVTIDPLTNRERDVAALVATGLTNRAIAERLVITEATTEVHVKHIMNKLGLTSRTQVALWAAKRGILERPRERAAKAEEAMSRVETPAIRARKA